jgi:hypothetical protein
MVPLVRWWDKLRPKPETPAQKVALANLDAVTREVAAEEENKEIDREHSHGGGVGPLSLVPGHSVELHHVPGDVVPEPVDDPDPGGGESMHDVMRGDDEKE